MYKATYPSPHYPPFPVVKGGLCSKKDIPLGLRSSGMSFFKKITLPRERGRGQGWW